MFAPILAIILAAPSALAITYRLCDEKNYIYAGNSVTIPIVLGPSLAVTIKGDVKAITVSGTITVVDGCHVILITN
jgi:hypothetical protein